MLSDNLTIRMSEYTQYHFWCFISIGQPRSISDLQNVTLNTHKNTSTEILTMHVTLMFIFNKRISSWLCRQFVTDDFNLKVEKKISINLCSYINFLVYLACVSKPCLYIQILTVYPNHDCVPISWLCIHILPVYPNHDCAFKSWQRIKILFRMLFVHNNSH